jgi:hypothetical protein
LTNRADVTKLVSYPKKLTEWFDTTAFAHPAVVNPASQQASVFIAPGTLGRNQMVGPAFRDMDASLGKDFPIWEGVVGHFAADAFNLTNTPAFQNPDMGMDDGNFGQITNTRANSQRELQLSLRFTF